MSVKTTCDGEEKRRVIQVGLVDRHLIMMHFSTAVKSSQLTVPKMTMLVERATIVGG